MTAITSHAHIELILNGRRITGWGTDDPPVLLETEESTSFTEGGFGKTLGMSMPRYGGTLRVRLHAHSPDVQWLVQQENARKQAMVDQELPTPFRGTLIDVARNIDSILRAGAIQHIPPRPHPGQTFEAIFRFGFITNNVDNGTFGGLYDETGA